MTTLTATELDLPDMRRHLTRRLHGLRRRVRVQLALEGLARVCAVVVVLALVSLVLDWRLQLSLTGRIVFVVGSLAAVGYVGSRRLLRPLRLRLDPIELAAALDEAGDRDASRAVAPKVATVLQLANLVEQPYGGSPALIDRAVRTSFASLEDVDFAHGVSRRHLGLSLVGLLGATAAPVVLAIVLPAAASLWAQRWLLASDQPWPRYTTIEVLDSSDGRVIVPRGEPAVLRVAVRDERTPTETVWLRIEQPDGQSQTDTLTQFGEGDFRYDLPPLQQPITISLSGGDARTGPITVQPVDRPRITEIRVVAKHPRDTEPHEHHFAGEDGSLRLLPQTEVELQFEANVPIAEVRVETEATAPRRFDRRDDRSFATQWTHREAVQLKITLVSADAGLVSHARPVAIGLALDRPPRVTLRASGVGQRITAAATVPLKLTANDDYGVRIATLRVGAEAAAESDSEPLYGPESPATETSVQASHRLEVVPMKLSPGDLLHVTGCAEDTCYTGAQSAESRVLVFRIVAPEELFREILLRQQGSRARFRKASDQSQELLEALDTAVFPEAAADLLARHRLAQRAVWQVARSLEEAVTEMRLNQLAGQEAHDLIERNVLAPLQRLHDQTMTRQRQALESLGRDDAEPVDDVLDRQRTITDEMDRLLKSMAQWDSFIDVVNQLNAVIAIEKDVRDDTNELRDTQVESVFDE